jgi:isoleucyl-tRNA synthetase
MESPMYRELPAARELEEEVLAFWRAEGIFEASLARSRGRPRFVFYEGPPTANGTPHNGHVLTRVIKDLFPRYRTLRGYHVERKAGWDTHGLPVEVEVEKELNMRAGFDNSRDAVNAYGLDNFSRRCIESVFRYTHDWEQMTDRVGFWVDLPSAYVTYHKSYVESVWWALKTLFARGLLYQGEKVVWWWPEGGTALSAGEVGEGYRDVDDPSVTVRLRLEGEPGTSLLAWTTTPWTLPSNVALAVGADLDYAWVRVGDEVVIAADALRPAGEVLRVVKGRDLVGLRYAPLYTMADPGGRAYEVVAGDHVSLDAGTGIVHTAPAYGEADHEVRRAHGLGLIAMVGPDGRFGPTAPDWLRGLHFKAADKPILRDLRERGLLFDSGTIRHSYPFSPRSKDDALFQLARPGWFIRTTAFKEQALQNNAAVQWLPEHIRDGRFGDFLRNNVDWALSRERFWGTPLPIWVCAGCGAHEAFGSVAELEARGAVGFARGESDDLQVHKPWIDGVTVPCAACAAEMRRVPEVIDCWFDSGCMPFAQHGFPHQGVEAFRESFPADFISEAVDQTRGWFYSLLMISTMLFDDETCAAHGLPAAGFPRPFKTCIVLGHVTDMDGKKESKSAGNYTSPDLVLRGRMRQKLVADPGLRPGTLGMVKAGVKSIDLNPGERLSASVDEHPGDAPTLAVEPVAGGPYGKDTVALHPDDIAAIGLGDHVWLTAPFEPPGADAFRWLFYASNPPWNNTRISLRNIREGQREFHLRLANVFGFFTIYANISGHRPTAGAAPVDLLDRWILAERDALVRAVTGLLDDYRIYEAARAISDFVDGLSNWYVRRSRSRFWGEGPEVAAALDTLHAVLSTLSVVIAPFVPFLAEAMHQRLGLPGRSVHLGDWPVVPAEASEADEALRRDMALLRELCSLGLAARARVGVRVRQPLRAAEIILADPARAAGLGPLLPLLQDELNVRELHFTQEAERFVEFRVKPDYPRLGKRLGKDMKACAAALSAASGAAVRQAVLGGGYRVELPGGPVLLTDEDVVVEVQPKADFQAAGAASAVVVLHAGLDDDLREEGLARELLSRLQARRKELDLGYTTRIRVELRAAPALAAAARRFEDLLQGEALVADWQVVPAEDGASELDGHRFDLRVEPVPG